MIINHNMQALNAHRQMGANQTNAQKSMEKLSSGLRINRAGDDAAGLAISEKMRGQIRGLDQASRNAQDGISLIQTAEGALNETHSILQRMRELSVQSANDTNTTDDRAELQKEVDQLAEEITRIAENTEFNTKNLLGKDGNSGFSGKFHIGANAGQSIEISIGNMDASTLGVTHVTGSASTVGNLTVTNNGKEATTITFAASTSTTNTAVDKTTAKINEDGTITVTLAQAAASAGTVGDISATWDDIASALEAVGVEATVTTGGTTAVTAGQAKDYAVTKGTEDTTKGINISTQTAASRAIKSIDAAMKNVSSERSKLGAVQNRLEHTINNLGTSSENLTAAESRIRDVDMAKEMMTMSKENILSQAAQAMLAQANQNPQQVLQLLR